MEKVVHLRLHLLNLLVYLCMENPKLHLLHLLHVKYVEMKNLLQNLYQLLQNLILEK
jgi:hypothetical protein